MNCNLQGALGQTDHVKIKLVNGGVQVNGRKYCVIINFLNKTGICFARAMPHNGPAIKGGCVTRRKHRAVSWFFSQKIVTVQGGYGALFAVQVQVL